MDLETESKSLISAINASKLSSEISISLTVEKTYSWVRVKHPTNTPSLAKALVRARPIPYTAPVISIFLE